VNEGARQEFAEFVAARSTRLIRLAYVLTGDQHAAEDLLQDALIKAAAHWGRIHTAPGSAVIGSACWARRRPPGRSSGPWWWRSPWADWALVIVAVPRHRRLPRGCGHRSPRQH
jgi:Sigma-70 region 2